MSKLSRVCQGTFNQPCCSADKRTAGVASGIRAQRFWQKGIRL